MQKTQVWPLVQKDPICCRATKPESHNYWASAPRAHTPQQEKALSMRSPHTTTRERLYRAMKTVNYKLALSKSIANNWTTKAFATCLYGDWTPCCYGCWPSTTLKGVQGGVGTLCSRDIGETGLYIVGCFQEHISWSQSFHLLISREALNPLMATSDHHD